MQRERPNQASRESSVGPQPQPVDNKESEQTKPKPETDERAAQLAEEKLERQTNTIFEEVLGGLTSVNVSKWVECIS